MRRRQTLVERYLNEVIDYGGEPCTRAEVILDMQANGSTQAMIDRWFQGYELGQRIRVQQAQAPDRVSTSNFG